MGRRKKPMSDTFHNLLVHVVFSTNIGIRSSEMSSKKNLSNYWKNTAFFLIRVTLNKISVAPAWAFSF